jgi:SAM-dependent methyltransferase
MKPESDHPLSLLAVERVASCLLCSGQQGREDARFAQLLALPRPFGVLRCPQCGLRWLSPRPTQDAYLQVYSDAFYFGGGDGAVDEYADLALARRPYFRDRLERMERTLSAGRPLRLLEIGAATGEFLVEARGRGHSVHGIEFSADARRTARDRHGLELLAPAQADDVGAGSLDAIHMNHVLEHLPDPLQSVRWCLERLRPGGLMVIEVPQQLDNDLDRVRRLVGMGGRHRAFDAYSLHHTFFFTPATARTLLELSGFSIEAATTANPMRTPLWPLSLRNVVLRALLWTADRVHGGGNIIEIYARRLS